MDQRIRGAFRSVLAVDDFEDLWQRDFEAFKLWIGVEDTREMFRAALALAEERKT